MLATKKNFLYCLLATILGFAVQANVVCNEYRSTAWDDLPTDVQKAAKRVGYFRARWDYNDKVNPMELVRYSDLTKKGQSNQWGFFKRLKVWTRNKVLPIIGYPHPKCYDMYVNHYAGYSWWALGKVKNMEGKKVRPFAIVLGWTKDKWDGISDPPESTCKQFSQLKWIEKRAAEAMGWDRVSWNAYPCSTFCKNHVMYAANCV